MIPSISFLSVGRTNPNAVQPAYQTSLASVLQGGAVGASSDTFQRQPGMSRGSTARFSGVLANMTDVTVAAYDAAESAEPNEHKLRPHLTRIFREQPSILAIARLIGQTPTDIHVVGTSDGSESFAHAIALKERLGEVAKDNIRIFGVDQEPGLIELANTGYLVCTDQEKVWANDAERNPGCPLRGPGWDRYLKHSAAPPVGFNSIVKRNPSIREVTRDPVAGIKIGQGMHWYQVNRDLLPPITFVNSSLEEYVTQAPVEAPQQVFVLSNMWGYEAEAHGADTFLGVIPKLRQRAGDKPTYVVIGEVEAIVIRENQWLLPFMVAAGMEPLTQDELVKAKVSSPNSVDGLIWRLKPLTEASET